MPIDVRPRVSSKHVQVKDAAIDPTRITQEDLTVRRLAGRRYLNPELAQKEDVASLGCFKNEVEYIMYDPRPQKNITSTFPMSMNRFVMELASARANVHFNPANTTIGIVTCGGLCPGLNDVIRSITLTAIRTYGVKRVIGFRYGYWGLSAAGRDTALELTTDTVRYIHRYGGTMLGSSRGPQPASEIVDTLEKLGVNVLFTVGGDGTQKGSLRIAEEARRRNLDIAVLGIPKTIDNDLSFSHRTFGFETAVEQACVAIRAAHSEASSHMFGIGIVKVMGRESGFIAAQSTISSSQASLCFIPENPVSREVVLKLIKRRFELSTFCVIVVAEGFGQDWADCSGAPTDASGNKKLMDIGVELKHLVEGFLKENKALYPQSTVKYIDPSYTIRACPPNASDAAFCTNLSTLAIHEAMSGATDCIISMRYNQFILVPIKAAVSIRKMVDTRGMLWRMVREVTIDLSNDAAGAVKRELQRELQTVSVKRESIINALSKL
jgi:6-phosphofructokinase 1